MKRILFSRQSAEISQILHITNAEIGMNGPLRRICRARCPSSMGAALAERDIVLAREC
jgi:hypothetical protein